MNLWRGPRRGQYHTGTRTEEERTKGRGEAKICLFVQEKRDLVADILVEREREYRDKSWWGGVGCC